MTPSRAVVSLILVCLVWGVSFTATKTILHYVSPLLYLGIRFTIATLLIAGSLKGVSRREIWAGVALGALFWSGFVFQSSGLLYTTASRSAFITMLSSPLVPVVHFLVYRDLPRTSTVLAVGLAVLGAYLLTSPDGGLGLNRGDILTLGCAFLFAGQIVAAGHYAPRVPVLRLLALELGTTAVLSLAGAPLLGTPYLTFGIPFLALIGFLSLSGLWSFHMQLRAQQVLSPTHTALVFTLEPVFASVSSFLLLGERLTALQLLGGALILMAIAAPALEAMAAAPAS